MWQALDDHQWVRTQKPLCPNKKVMDLIISSTLDLRFLILRWSIFFILQLGVKLTTYPPCPGIPAWAPLGQNSHLAISMGFNGDCLAVCSFKGRLLGFPWIPAHLCFSLMTDC